MESYLEDKEKVQESLYVYVYILAAFYERNEGKYANIYLKKETLK